MFSVMLRVIALAGSLMAACSPLSEEKTAVDYVSVTRPAALPGAEKVNVSVTASDKRAQLKDRIATKRNVTASRIVATNDVVDLVRSAVEQGFKAQGFVVGADGLAVTLDVQNFFNDFRSGRGGFYAAVADVTFTLRVKSSAGVTLYTRSYEGTGRVDPVYNQSAENTKEALEAALANAVKQVIEDGGLDAVLLSAGSKASGTSMPRRT